MKKKGLSVFVGAFALGAFAGYVTGLLLAPKSGRELRRDIENTSCEFCNRAKISAEKTGEKIVQYAHELQSNIDASVHELNDMCASLSEVVDQKVHQIFDSRKVPTVSNSAEGNARAVSV